MRDFGVAMIRLAVIVGVVWVAATVFGRFDWADRPGAPPRPPTISNHACVVDPDACAQDSGGFEDGPGFP